MDNSSFHVIFRVESNIYGPIIGKCVFNVTPLHMQHFMSAQNCL
jgi:hypothetical protein